MLNVWLVAGRELKAYLRSPLGYIIAAAVLLADGILFFAWALSPDKQLLSAEVLREFFYAAGGVTMFACIALSMRLFALEHEQGTLVLLKTSPVRDYQLVLGKFLSVLLVITVITALSSYLPALIFVNGKVSIGHIVVGYVGILMLAAGTISVGLFASAVAKSQVVAVIIGALIMITLLVLWLLAKQTDPPINEFVEGLAFHHNRQKHFLRGVLRLEHVIYYVAVTFFFLLAATKTLEARRWR